jgi:hypothetical protein
VNDRIKELDAIFALYWAAGRGDWEELAKHIEQGGAITAEMRAFLAAVLRGEKSRPKNKPAAAATLRRHHEITEFILWARKRGAKNATQMAADKFNMEPRAVERIFKACKGPVASVMADFDKEWEAAGGADLRDYALKRRWAHFERPDIK